MQTFTGRRARSVTIISAAAFQLVLAGLLAALGIFAVNRLAADVRIPAICVLFALACASSIILAVSQLRQSRYGHDDASMNDASPPPASTELVHQLSQPLNVIALAVFNALAEIEDAEQSPASATGMGEESRQLVEAKLRLIDRQVDRLSGVLAQLRVGTELAGD